jgi:hypothetical protein
MPTLIDGSTILAPMRGRIADACIGYPDVLHIEVRDLSEGIWRLMTQNAEWSPSDPAKLIGRSIEDARLDECRLQCKLSDGSMLEIRPPAGDKVEDDDPPYWELITPAGIFFEFGPGMRWRCEDANAVPGWPRAAQEMEPHAQVARLLEAIPRGDLNQNTFRMEVELDLMNGLGRKPEHPGWTVLQIVEHAAKRARARAHDFEPVFDREALIRLSEPR